MISVENLSKIYNDDDVITNALLNVTFSIKEGEFIGLMGRSGSGKSTLLHQLGLLDTPTSGKISLLGKDVLTMSGDEKTYFRLHNLGYVFQEYGLIPEFTALENVAFPALATNNDKAYERALELLTYVGLRERAHHTPHRMSGGEMQRVAIARALINDPAILFADEPTANLDSHSSEVVLSLFKQLQTDLKKTILMVTHEIADKKYTDRIIFLKDGEVIEGVSGDGTPFLNESPRGILRPFK